MSIAANHVTLCFRLLQARDTARELLGDEYDSRIDAVRADLRQIASKKGCRILDVVLEAADSDLSAGAMLHLLAAACDEIESKGGTP